jgi:hypothetical protein
MAAIWVTVAYEKREALAFALTVLGSGLLARFAFRAYRQKARPVEKVPFPPDAPRILIASRGDTGIVDQGYDRAAELGAAAVVCLVREASFLLDQRGIDAPDPALDPEAARLFEYARKKAQDRDIPMRTFYTISPSPMFLLADYAVTLGVVVVHVGGSRRSKLEKALRGSPLEELKGLLPEGIQMIVHRPPQGGGADAK